MKKWLSHKKRAISLCLTNVAENLPTRRRLEELCLRMTASNQKLLIVGRKNWAQEQGLRRKGYASTHFCCFFKRFCSISIKFYEIARRAPTVKDKMLK